MSATPEHGGLSERERRDVLASDWATRVEVVERILAERAAAPDALRERIEGLATEWTEARDILGPTVDTLLTRSHGYRLRALLDDPAAAGRATDGGGS